MVPLFGLALIMIVVIVYASVTQANTAQGSDPALAQLTALVLATLAAGAVITTFIVLNWLIGRMNKITRVADALTNGDMTARTMMQATDEISRIGASFDRYAESVQVRQDDLRVSLRRQRREIAHLTSVLEAMSDGVIVQDLSGQVTFINEPAKNLLDLPSGLRTAIEDGKIEALTTLITDTLGPALAPGLFALGEPKRIELNSDQNEQARTISVGAAAVMSLNKQRVGTVLILRDVTDETRREKARDALLTRIDEEIGAPLEAQARIFPTAAGGMMEFAQSMLYHAVALQKMIVEMRDLTATNARTMTRADRPLSLDKLVYALVNEWRGTAGATNLMLEIQIDRPGLQVMGDERRLRWAVGNILDNAIKYTPPGGKIIFEVKGEERGMARLRVRDTGVGISDDELAHVFTRFYRGTPTTSGGRALRVPGSGQGLTVAKEIIEAHGGMIVLRSTLNVGTAVYFTIPTIASDAQPKIVPMSQESALPYIEDDAVGDDTIRFS